MKANIIPERNTNGGIFSKHTIYQKKKKMQREKDKSEKSHTCRKMGIILMQSIEVVTNLKKTKT